MSRRRKDDSHLDGLLLVDKPRGYTSHDVVQQARRALHQRRIGHCGTLDPEATGLLLLTLGRGTRLTRFLIKAPKIYEGTIRFGIATDTYDAAGEVLAEQPIGDLSRERVSAAMASFEGWYEQVPPPYCAKKVDGKKFYELARRGEQTPREPSRVRVYEFAPSAALTESSIRFRLACASGTYARSLAHELGQNVGVGAHLSSLRRLEIGGFRLENATRLEDLKEAHGSLDGLGDAFIPFDRIPLPFPEIEADDRQERRIQHGQTVLIPALASAEGDWVKVTNSRSEFIAVGTVVERLEGAGAGVIQPKIVFKTAGYPGR